MVSGDYTNFYDDDTPSPVNLDQEQVESISTYAANGYSIRLYVDDDRIKAEATKSYLDNSAYDLALPGWSGKPRGSARGLSDIFTK